MLEGMARGRGGTREREREIENLAGQGANRNWREEKRTIY